MCYNRFVNPARFLCALRAMRPRHAVLLTPLISLRPVFSRPRIQIAHESSQIPSFVFERLRTLPSSVSCKSFPCHTSENSPVSPAIATDPKTPSRKSFDCHTSETPPGGFPPRTRKLICNFSLEPSTVDRRSRPCRDCQPLLEPPPFASPDRSARIPVNSDDT